MYVGMLEHDKRLEYPAVFNNFLRYLIPQMRYCYILEYSSRIRDSVFDPAKFFVRRMVDNKFCTGGMPRSAIECLYIVFLCTTRGIKRLHVCVVLNKILWYLIPQNTNHYRPGYSSRPGVSAFALAKFFVRLMVGNKFCTGNMSPIALWRHVPVRSGHLCVIKYTLWYLYYTPIR